MGPLAKLYACCLNHSLETQASSCDWRAPTQAGFRRYYKLKGLLVPVDYIPARVQIRKLSLIMCLVEKAFDMIPCNTLLHILQTEYRVEADMLESIRHILINTRGQLLDGKHYFLGMK